MDTHFLVNGTFVAGEGPVQDVLDPATGSVIANVAEADERQVASAVEAAANAFESWSATVPKERASLLLQLADRIEADAETYAALESLNCGKPYTTFMDDEIPAIADAF